MPTKKILLTNDPILRIQSTAVKNVAEATEISNDLIDSLRATGGAGVGLSSNQIGYTKRIFVAKLKSSNQPNGILTFINPVITKYSKETTADLPDDEQYLEGCLSLPGIYAFVERPLHITLSYYSPESFIHKKKITQTYSGDNAIIIQHEIDHLDGILFTDKSIAQGYAIYEIDQNNNLKPIKL